MNEKTKLLLRYVITTAVGGIITLAMVLGRGITTAENLETTYKLLCDGFFVPGALITCFGLLVIAGNGGTFDMLAYGITSFFSVFTRQARPQHRSFYEYRESMKQKNRSFSYLIVVGCVFLAVSVAMLLLYNSVAV